jgi:Mrp family chromosome partitioning ATPase
LAEKISKKEGAAKDAKEKKAAEKQQQQQQQKTKKKKKKESFFDGRFDVWYGNTTLSDSRNPLAIASSTPTPGASTSANTTPSLMKAPRRAR